MLLLLRKIAGNAACVVAVIASLMAVPTFNLHAQATTGAIEGTVQDATGAVVPKVEVFATKVETGITRSTTTSAHGDFSFNSIEPGTYNLKFTADGFKTKQIDHLMLTTGSTLPLPNVGLEPGAISETVTVQAQGATIATTSSDRSDLLSSRQISDLVVRGRNFTDLVTLSPGVINTSKSTDISSSPSIYVNGNRNTANAIFIDGIPASDMSSTQMKGMVSQDSIAEVKIETSNFQAEYGRNAGSNIVAVTKSGANQFHGLVSYFNRNEAYNANNYFNNLNGVARPRYRYNTFTYNIGGPVIIPGIFRNPQRDKLFFFFNEEFWPTSNSTTGSVTVPTALERNGDFSQSFNSKGALIKVIDPTTNAQFPGNVVPSARLNAAGQALLRVFPLPNFSNTAVSKGAYNYVFTTPVRLPIHTESLRMDYHPTAKDTISGTFSDFFVNDTGALGIPDTGTQNIPLSTKTYFTHSTFVTGRELHIFNSSMLNEASFGYLQQNAGDIIADTEVQKLARTNRGFNVGQFYSAANPLGVLPNVTFGSSVQNAAVIGIESRFPLVNHYHLYNLTDSFSYTHGSHNVKAGVYLEKYDRYQKTQSGVNFNGLFDFSTSTANPAVNTNYAYANAVLGNFNSYKETSTAGLFNLLDHDTEFYVQDNWRVTRKLTFDLGVRMYYITPFTESTNSVSGFVRSQYSAGSAAKLIAPVKVGTARMGQDPGTGATYPAVAIGAISPSVGNPADGVVTAINPGSLPRSLQGGAGLKAGPRLGFAYDVHGNGTLAIRGGFGLFQNRFQENYFDNFVAQTPLAQTPQIFYGNLSTFLSSPGLLFPSNIFGPDTNPHVTRVANYSLSVQQQMGLNMIFDLAYVGTQGRHLQAQVDQNGIPLGTNFLASSRDTTQAANAGVYGGQPNCVNNAANICNYPPLPAAFLRPTIGYNGIYQLNNGFGSSYNGLQASLQRRFANHLQFGVAYTWSKVLDYTDTDGDIVEPVVPIRQYYRSVATFNRPQNLVVNFILDLPDVHERYLGVILNHWQISGISTFQSGAPLGVAVSTSSGTDITGSTSIAARAQLVGNPNLSRGDRTFARYFNIAAITLPAVGTFGNAPRLFLRGPGINSTDVSLMKNITLKERLKVQLRFEAYNVANHTQASVVNTTATFNSSTGALPAVFGQVTAARDPRQLQMSARVSF